MAADFQKDQVVEHIIELFAQRGAATYAGEAVSQTEHALQAAWEAEKQGEGSAMIAAALLHDLGHLLHELGEECADAGIDDQHEQRAAAWLADYYPPEVTEPIRLHVASKRYLCAVNEKYRKALSPASQLSLKLQGGPFNEQQAHAFDRLPYAKQAVRLRHWDDISKIEKLQTPDLEHFRPHLEAALYST